MSVIERKAVDVLNELSGAPVHAIRASAIAIGGIDIGSIVSIITALIQQLQNCRKSPTQAQRIMRRPGPVERARVGMIVRDRLGKPNKSLVAAVQNVAADCSIRDVAAMMDEVSP